jgi:IMP dehydrogenase
MIKENIKFDFDDLSLIPTIISDIKTRKDINILDINKKLPLFVSPMDTVIDEYNYKIFIDLGFEVCIPRGIKNKFDNNFNNCFISYGLDEIEEIINNNEILPKKVLIDVANGHSIRVYEISKLIKKNYDIELMIGNVANPLTFKLYCDIDVDYVRCGIGAGHACTTSANSSIHYPMGSLIKECYDIKRNNNYKTKIIADGGFKNYDDIIKSIGCGSDYVMLGSIINKSIESCGDNFIIKDDSFLKIDKNDANLYFNEGVEVFKLFRGMSTKEVQKKWGKKELKTSEGITKFNKVEYTIGGWTENFKDYLKSCLSYQGIKNIKDFIGEAEYVFITQNSFNRFNK